jgi:hypothetical protein
MRSRGPGAQSEYPLNENLDTSESYAQSQNYLNYIQQLPPVGGTGTSYCTNDGLIPTASLDLTPEGGTASTTTITDNNQILNDHGVDIGGPECGVPFKATSTNGSNVLTNVQTLTPPDSNDGTYTNGTSGLVVGDAFNGAGFPNGFTLGVRITAIDSSADTITVSEDADATQGGLLETELFPEAEPWSTSGVTVTDPAVAVKAGTVSEASKTAAAGDAVVASHASSHTKGRRRKHHSKHTVRRRARRGLVAR